MTRFDAKDAERYRFLREAVKLESTELARRVAPFYHHTSRKQLDKSIDQLMEKARGKAEKAEV